MSSSDFCFRYFHFAELESTNIHARALISAKNAKEGDVIRCDFQTKGRGQQGKGWESEWGKNLLFSVVLSPELEVENQVYLNMAISNALRSALDSLSVKHVAIKWPNDILVNGSKVAGILIENSLSAFLIKNSVVGIGLNVNQLHFQKYQREATSLRKELEKEFDLQSVLEKVLLSIANSYAKLKKKRFKAIKEEYLAHLYGFNSEMSFEDENGAFRATITGVDLHGRLLLQREEEVKAYGLKELVFKD